MIRFHGRRDIRRRRHLPLLAIVCSLACTPVAIQAAQVAAESLPATDAKNFEAASPTLPAGLSADDLRERTRIDVAAFADALRRNYIYAAYPDPARWETWFDRELEMVKNKLPLVRDEAGYQAVLTNLAAALKDAHVSVHFDLSRPVPLTWPGFVARFDNGTYRTTASRQTHIIDGAEVSECDGKPMSWWIATIARLEVGLPDTLDVTRNEAALRVFVDRDSPLRRRPAQCTIGGRSVTLDWTSVPTREISAIMRSLRGGRTPEVSTRLIRDNGAWVKLGYFHPNDAAQAKAFRAAINAAPSLRTKRFIILDVRGNGGGPYNWFMAYLRELYGQAYADHYATARLHVRGVFRLSPAYLELDRQDRSVPSDVRAPADPPYEIHDAANNKLQRRRIAAGKSLFRSMPISIPSHSRAPPNPVRAQVYVLTDMACASACIAFVDELKQFPGVRQIGLPTAVDSRSGTPVRIELPSRNAFVMIAAMTRDGRIRADNEPQLPSMRFTGDIRDDAAVETWFLRENYEADGCLERLSLPGLVGPESGEC